MSDFEFNKNEDSMRLMVDQLKHKLKIVAEGGGKRTHRNNVIRVKCWRENALSI